MPEWLIIARREFLERVRTVWFLVVTVLGPVIMTGMLVVPAWLAVRSAEQPAVIEVVDETGRGLFPRLVRQARAQEVSFELRQATTGDDELLLRRIRDEVVSGYLRIPPGALTGEPAVYRGENATNFSVMSALERLLEGAAIEIRAEDKGIRPETLAALGSPPMEVDARHDSGRGETSSARASFVAGYAVMFILYIAILLYAVNVMRSVIQEKSSRVVELVVSAVRPRALMLGKVIGVGSVGLLQLAIWSGIALGLINYSHAVLGLFGIAGAAAFEMPPLGAVDVLVILTYFVLGYFFYAALHAGIGAMVNSEQEAQQLQSPIVLLLIIPLLCVQLVANQPRGGTTQFVTLFPFSSPVLMPMRYLLGGATWAEIGLSIGILIVSIAVVVAVAARIYRVGILMYGKRPSLRELARWIRYP